MSCPAPNNGTDEEIETDGDLEAWCASEKNTCPLICQQTGDGTTKVNDCDPVCPPIRQPDSAYRLTHHLQKSLTYGCICGNGKQPNVSEYSLSLPYFVCTEWGNQCVTECNGNNNCASSCRQDHPCGAQDPKKYNITTTAASATGAEATASTTDAADTVYTSVDGNSDSSSSSSDKSGSATALEAGRKWGLAVVMGGMFVGFALL